MNITIASKLMELYAACPKCGCEVIGNGKGLLECDTAAGFFKRSCGCGWHVEVMEGITEGSLTEDPPELPAEDEDEPEPVIFADPEPESAPEPIFEPEPVLEPEKIRPWNGFVHIRCEACHKESTTCLRTPTDTYICKECGTATAPSAAPIARPNQERRSEAKCMSEQKDLQEQLLLRAQECRKSVLVITTNGFQMRGVIVGSDRFVIALKGDGRLQMVYKHAISTIVLTEEQL